ncbi:MAG TPA: glucose-6-phosphate isomerase [Amnibacterium sp.]|nr:glucose-6-phosphate isomerase [Amnibacterium sp.]
MSVRIALGGAAEEALGRVLTRLVDEKVASGVTAQDPTLWGADAERDAARRLGWTEAVAAARPLVPVVRGLREQLRRAGARRVVLCSGGGAARAAAAIAGSQGAGLTVLATTDPTRVRTVLRDLGDATVVLAAPAGAPYDLDPHLRSVVQAYAEFGMDPASRIVVVAEPGSALASVAARAGLRTLDAEPLVGDRFSALSAAALVPSALAGADIAEVLDEAESEELNLAIDDPSNNGLRLAAALGGARRDVLAIVADGTHLVGFDAWAEQVLAGSGLVPVVLAPDAPELTAAPDDLLVLRLVADAHDARARAHVGRNEVLLSGSLGELLLVLEYATVLIARLLGADPFDDRLPPPPAAPAPPPAFAEDGVEVRLPDGATASDLRAAVDDLVAHAQQGRVVLHVSGDPRALPQLAAIRAALADRTRRPVPLAIGPAAATAARAPEAVLELATEPSDDVAVPGTSGTYGELTRIEAHSAVAAYTARGSRVLALRLTTPEAADAVLAAATARKARA